MCKHTRKLMITFKNRRTGEKRCIVIDTSVDAKHELSAKQAVYKAHALLGGGPFEWVLLTIMPYTEF